jgi:hypothetical protein
MKLFLVGLDKTWVENMLLNFDGASLDQINELTDEAGIPRFGHILPYDGGTSVFIKQQLLCNLYVEIRTYG